MTIAKPATRAGLFVIWRAACNELEDPPGSQINRLLEGVYRKHHQGSVGERGFSNREAQHPFAKNQEGDGWGAVCI